MKLLAKIWKITYPGLYGLLIYTAIRLITDTASRYNVLAYRDLFTNAIEIFSVIVVGYLTFYMLRRFERSRKPADSLTGKEVLKEFGIVSAITVVVMNSTIGVMVATTDNGMDSHDFVMINIIPLLFILVTYSIRRGNSYLKGYVEQKTELERIRRDKSETELQFLKSQYHPHFLFNALNTVYFQMDESTGKAKSTIEKLAELLRYQLYEVQREKVPLRKELEFIRKYVALQRERLPDDVTISLELGEAGNEMVYPLLTIPLVENAFKYVGGKERSITIECKLLNGSINFSVTNSFDKRMNGSKYSGLGLNNLRRRLELLYPDRSELRIESAGDQYIAQLKLPQS